MAINRLYGARGGWIKILEVMISITLLSGVIVFMYATRVDSVSLDGYVYSYQKEILSEISIDNDLRNLVLESSDEESKEGEVISSVTNSLVLPENLDFTIKICDLTNPSTPCNMDPDLFISLLGKEIYVSEIIVASNLTKYEPKKVKLFIWEDV